METSILTIETAESFAAAVHAAADLLRKGAVIALPTETVYGLAANALNPDAVQQIFEIKRRPAYNPLIVHVCSIPMARDCVRDWPTSAALLAQAFWPGPLTLILPRAGIIPDPVTGGGDTVGVRLPAHPLMQKVIECCAFPLAAPSANPTNQLSPTTALHVAEGLPGKIPLIVDAGPSSVGIESTVLDLTGSPPRVLRPGMISAGQIARVLGSPVRRAGSASGPLKSPGMLAKHYAPRAHLLLARWHNDAELQRIAERTGVPFHRINVIASDRIPLANPYARVAIIPPDPDAYARAIFAELHRSDQLGAGLIIVEEPPSTEEWEGIRDRLRRASS